MNPAFVYAIIAFIIWGSFPVVFDWLHFANVWEILFHRIIWSAIFITPITLYLHKINISQLLSTIRDNLAILSISALLISINWGVFVYAVHQGEVLETSLGYFLSPLCSIFIGTMFFKEQLNKFEKISLLLMIVALTIKAIDNQGIPWVSLVLAISFSLYGAVHKKNKISSDISLTAESWLLSPISLIGLYFFMHNGQLVYGQQLGESLLLMSLGIITVTPLWLFSRAAKGMKLTQLGFFNYLTPSLSFILGLWYFNEQLTFLELFSFILIWIALVLISIKKLARAH